VLVAAKCVPPIVPKPVLCVEENADRAEKLEPLVLLPKCEELMLFSAWFVETAELDAPREAE